MVCPPSKIGRVDKRMPEGSLLWWPLKAASWEPARAVMGTTCWSPRPPTASPSPLAEAEVEALNAQVVAEDGTKPKESMQQQHDNFARAEVKGIIL